MRQVIAVGTILAFVTSQALAQGINCNAGPGRTQLSQMQIQTEIDGHYACGNNGGDGSTGWNELHDGGTIKEVGDHSGPPEPVGTYAISDSGGLGVITYNYDGPTYAFNVTRMGTGNLYMFCLVGSPTGIIIRTFTAPPTQPCQ